MMENTDGLRVVNKEQVSDNEVSLAYMTYYNGGTNDTWGKMNFQRLGNVWLPLLGR